MPDARPPVSPHAKAGPPPDPAFTAAAHAYKARLFTATSPADFHAMWRETSLPYRLATPDPNAPAYRDEVKAIYRALTGLDYDVGAELTSTKQTDAQFQAGYPWVANDLGVVAQELSKTVQAIQALQRFGAQIGPGNRVVEFGAGWGNLAIPLAKAGFAVTAIDIDTGFTARLQRLAAEQHIALDTFDGTFLAAATTLPGQFETVIFQSSFHHCLDFDDLLSNISRRLLTPDGRILFLSEPILNDLAFPWGIRYDGEALWAVMVNGWLELGFHPDFFIDLLFRHGLLATRVPGIPGLVGDGWCATRTHTPIPFPALALSAAYSDTFHPPQGNLEWGRYCRRHSRLPGLGTTSCTLHLKNFGTKPQTVEFHINGQPVARTTLEAQQAGETTFPTAGHDIDITSQVFIPNDHHHNGDTREIGMAILAASWQRA